MFEIDEDTGEITVAKKLDREKQDSYQVTALIELSYKFNLNKLIYKLLGPGNNKP